MECCNESFLSDKKLSVRVARERRKFLATVVNTARTKMTAKKKYLGGYWDSMRKYNNNLFKRTLAVLLKH